MNTSAVCLSNLSIEQEPGFIHAPFQNVLRADREARSGMEPINDAAECNLAKYGKLVRGAASSSIPLASSLSQL